LFHCGRTDRRDEANSRFLQFCERTYSGHEVDTAVTEWLLIHDVAFCYKRIEKLLSGKYCCRFQGSTAVVQGTVCESSEIKSPLFVRTSPKIIIGNLFSQETLIINSVSERQIVACFIVLSKLIFAVICNRLLIVIRQVCRYGS